MVMRLCCSATYGRYRRSNAVSRASGLGTRAISSSTLAISSAWPRVWATSVRATNVERRVKNSRTCRQAHSVAESRK
ncbi:hypothetical protein RKD44_003405 [Streptomyces collinus]